MQNQWQVLEGTGWIQIPGFGRINPRRDNVNGGRNYFDAMLDNGEYAKVSGLHITGGPETWQYVVDQPFLLADHGNNCIEVEISILQGGRYCVKYRPSIWPDKPGGGW